MKILVTGGAGFVGSHLIEDLLSQGHEVTCLDNFSTGKLSNIESCRKNINLVKGDIRDSETVINALEGIDLIFHLAAQISVSRSMREPSFDASVNIIGFLNLLESMLKGGTRKLVYVSTGGAIYGEPTELPVSENAIEKPISAYGLSKLVGERYLEWFHKTYGLSYSIIRPANIYGPRQDPRGEAGVISIFLGNFLMKKPIAIFGDGYDTRDYIYVKDITNVCIKAMNTNQNTTFNIGTGIQTNLLNLVNIIEKVTELKTIPIFEPPRPGDVKHISLDYTKAKNILKWEPKVSLEKGIKLTWDWFKYSVN